MLEPLAKSEIDGLIHEAIEELETDARSGRMNTLVAHHLGAIARLIEFDDVARRVELLLSSLSLADFLNGSITNIELGSVDVDRLRRIEAPAEFAAKHPICDDQLLAKNLNRFAKDSPHLALCLVGDIAGAKSAAKQELDYEEIALTFAALGKYSEARTFIDAQPVISHRRDHVRFVILLEKCRRADPTHCDEIQRVNPRSWDRLAVILALAQRLPWSTYPYPDY